MMWATFAAAIVAGVLQGFSMAWPQFALGEWLGITGQSIGWLQCLSLALLAALLLHIASQEREYKASASYASKARKRSSPASQGFCTAGVFSTAAMCSTWGWLYVSMHQFGGLPEWLAALAVLLLAMALSLYFAITGGLWVVIFRRYLLQSRLQEGRYATHRPEMLWPELKLGITGVFLFAALWTLAELARGQWFTGFPWGAGGYAHTQSLWSAFAPWLGVYGIGLISAGVAMSLPLSWSLLMASRTRAWQYLVISVLGVAAVLPWGMNQSQHTWTQAGEKMVARLLQGNIPQDEKFIPGQGIRIALNWYGEELRNSRETLIVTPETAIPVLPRNLPDTYWQPLKDKYQAQTAHSQNQQLALVGIPMGGAGEGYSNSVLAFGAASLSYRYDKQHLVPFGEFIPPFFQWFVRLMNIPLGDFEQKKSNAGVLTWQGQRLLPQICYEDLFGEEMAQYFQNESQAPTVLVNMSNLAWFGQTTAPAQHAYISSMRALEFQRPVIRATNTGLTAFMDAKGKVSTFLTPFTRGALVGEFEGRTGLTPYARWVSQWGLLPLWLICGAIVLVLGLFSLRSGSRAL